MRGFFKLTNLLKLALVIGILSVIGSAAMAASNQAAADALSEAAARAQSEFNAMNVQFQTGVRTRIIVENELRVEEPALDDEGLLISSADH